MKSCFDATAATPGGACGAARAFFRRCVLQVLLLCFALATPFAASAESVCAEVKIEIKQSVTLERQAFDAVLRVRNGLTMPVEKIEVELLFQDQNGNSVPASNNPNGSGKFFYGDPELSEMTGDPITGTAAVAGTRTGEARWLIIPTHEAGGENPAGISYRIGAKIHYEIASGSGPPERKSVEVAPDSILVKPTPRIRLDYFKPSFVYGDDPSTDPEPIEPSEPFTLGVRVWNYGYGPAHSLAIETAQPKIVNNQQGLLATFQILQGFVDDGPASASLKLDFGDIAAARARVGRWNMTSSLIGQFENFEATIRHADDLGGEMTALVTPVQAHTLVRDVLADLPGRDGIRDFLARDVDTIRLYESDGVLVQGPAASDTTAGSTEVTETGGTLTTNGGSGTLSTAVAANNFIYSKVSISQALAAAGTVRAVRSDGKALPAPNAWLSMERASGGTTLLYFLNVFDHHPAGLGAGGNVSYLLTFGDAPALPVSVRGAVYEDLDADGVRDGGEPAIFDAAIALTGTDAQGNAVQKPATTDATGAFAFVGLAPGTYRLAVADVPGYHDGMPTVGSAGGLIGQSAIDHIVLASGTHATGYAFAKTQTQASGVTGDLSLASLTASSGTPVVGQPFNVVVTAANAGPQAVPALVRLSLPANVTLDAANASAGTYDSGTSTWNPGTLGAGTTPTLTLVLKANVVGPFSIGAVASVQGAQTVDPVAGNNARTLSLDAREAGGFTLAAEIRRETRVLALAGCPSTQLGNGCEDVTRKAALEAMFDEAGVRHHVVVDEDAFVAELRGGEWNTFWLSSGATQKLGPTAVVELSQALVRQEWLIADNPYADDPGSESAQQLEALIPARPTREIKKGISGNVSLADSAYFPGGVVATTGSRYEWASNSADYEVLASYEVEDGTVVGPELPLTPAALRINRTIVTGFDLFDALSQDATLRAATVARLLQATQPELPDAYVVGDYVSIGATATNTAGSLSAWTHFSLPAGATLAHARPAPYDASSGVAWTRTIATDTSFTPSAGIRLSTPIGNRVVQVQARDGGAAGAPLAAAVDIPFVVTHHGDIAMSLRATFDGADMPNLVQAIDDVLAARAGGRLSDAIAGMIGISRELDSSWRNGGDYSSELAVRVGRVLRGLQREWYASLASCAASMPVATAQDWRPVDREAPALIAAYGSTPAWLIGFVDSTVPAYGTAGMDGAPGVEHGWQLTIDAAGEARIEFTTGGGSQTQIVSYLSTTPGANGRVFGFGNNIELKAAAFPLEGLASVEASITNVDGVSVSLPPVVVGDLAPTVAARYLRVPAGAASLDIVGRFKAGYLGFGGGLLPTPPLNEMFKVRTFHSDVCRRPEG